MNAIAATILSGLLSAAACFAQPPAAPTSPAPTPPAQAAAPAAEAVSIRLISAGEEPRRTLRYTPTIGTRATVITRMKMTSEVETPGAGRRKGPDMPAMLLTVDVIVTAVSPNGDISYSMTFTKADVDAAPDANADSIESVRSSLAALVNATGNAVMSSRGESRGVTFKLMGKTDPVTEQMFQGLKNSMRQLTVPLPAEAVGTGASWEVGSNITTLGVTLRQTTTMTLKALTDKGYELQEVVTQHAEPQDFTLPGMPADAKMRIVSMANRGTGTIKGAFAAILPLDSSISMATSQEMAMSDATGSPSRSFKQQGTIEMSMRTAASADARK